jgi:hypothetical protein
VLFSSAASLNAFEMEACITTALYFFCSNDEAHQKSASIPLFNIPDIPEILFLKIRENTILYPIFIQKSGYESKPKEHYCLCFVLRLLFPVLEKIMNGWL